MLQIRVEGLHLGKNILKRKHLALGLTKFGGCGRFEDLKIGRLGCVKDLKIERFEDS
jgi:hypothetical protein